MWWNSLSSIEHVYWIIAVASSIVLFIQLIIACFAGFDFGSDIELEHDIDTGPDFQLLTVRNVVAFFSLMGWSGLTLLDKQVSIPITIVFSFLCGTVMMVISASFFFFISKLQSNGNIDLGQAVGKTARVYLTIPEKNSGIGKVQVGLKGKLIELKAVTEGKEIKTGMNIKINAITNSIVSVEKI